MKNKNRKQVRRLITERAKNNAIHILQSILSTFTCDHLNLTRDIVHGCLVNFPMTRKLKLLKI